MQYRAEIDGLRALAVLPVILCHAGFSIFSGGYIGVDVFFVISGFLITSILIRELDQGRFSLPDFYERRARRILPALFFVMAACLPVAAILFVPQDLKDFAQSLTAVAFFSSNILFWSESGYFSGASELKPLLHTWSLAVEEQYYILFPLWLMLTWRWGIKITLIGLTLGFALSLFLAQMIVSRDASFAFFMLPTRAWELLMGSFVAFALFRYPDLARPGWLAQGGSLAGLALVVFAIFVFDKETPFPSLYTLVPVLGAALIILCARRGTLVHALLSQRALTGIGLLSYSAYLWHQPLFAFTRYAHATHPPIAVMLGLVIVTFVLAYVTWRWVERPFRIKGRVGRAWVFNLSAAGLVGFAVLGIGGHLLKGVPMRFSPVKQELFASASASPKRGACHNIAQPDNVCHYFVDAPTWAVFGDSHSIELAYGLATRLRAQDIGVMQFSYAGCGPQLGTDHTDKCGQWSTRSIDHILANDTIDTVVVSYRIAAYLAGKHENIYPAQPDLVGPEKQAQVWESYIKTIQAFVDRGKTVHLVLQAPEVPADIKQMVRRAGSEAIAKENFGLAGVPRSWWEARMAYVTQRLGDIPAAVQIHDPADTFCDAATCYLAHDKRALYFDDDHVSLAGAGLIADQILKGSEPEPGSLAGINPRRKGPG
ncbi:hypothetical protein ROLI_045250 (plasmid) [Roseobacter fucihabitans]|uniref:Acyltransferase n=1 Tax=Roseobacter fucihabitans TaxID=1537242 RepID=A0ABZ2BZR3_9RHOB|nr:acyltransferase family protein [Roseobacter litoralis]MBC6967240.1 O-acetyltransferase OatA [Roseobacter litoralis]